MAALFILSFCELVICAPDSTLAQAEALMDEAEYVEAERTLTRGLTRPHLSTAIKIRSYWLIGICYISLSQPALAKSIFHKLLLLSPLFEPDKQTSPKILSVFHEAKEHFRQSGALDALYQPKILFLEKSVQFSVASSEYEQDIKRVVLYVRRIGSSNFTAVDLSPDLENRHIYTGIIPSHILVQKNESNTIEYYVEALSASQSKLCGIASSGSPTHFLIKSQDSPAIEAIESQNNPVVWPYWTGAGVILLGGIIYATVALATSEDHAFRIVVHR